MLQATHRTHPACLSSHSSLSHDATRDGARSGLRGAAVGGSFLHETDGRFFCAFEPHNSSQQNCEVI